jgi:uncharacterized protein YbjT (DUF2867 family)
MKPKTALIMGASGLTGGILLKELLDDDRYSKIKVVGRNPLQVEHLKLEEYLIDFKNMGQYKEVFIADECYCCIGTTRAKTPDENKYRQIDFGIPVEAARICAENAVSAFIVMSSLGADDKSQVFYSRLKGQMEKAILDLQFRKTIIVRPSLIAGPRKEKRRGEQIAKLFMGALNPLLIGGLRKYRTIHPQTIARAMVWLANNPVEKSIFLSDELQSLGK